MIIQESVNQFEFWKAIDFLLCERPRDLLEASTSNPSPADIKALEYILTALNHFSRNQVPEEHARLYFDAFRAVKDRLDAFEDPDLKKAALLFSSLSPKEAEILELMKHGKPTKLIAKEIEKSENTVRNQIASIFKKLEVGNRTEATILAMKHGPQNMIDAKYKNVIEDVQIALDKAKEAEEEKKMAAMSEQDRVAYKAAKKAFNRQVATKKAMETRKSAGIGKAFVKGIIGEEGGTEKGLKKIDGMIKDQEAKRAGKGGRKAEGKKAEWENKGFDPYVRSDNDPNSSKYEKEFLKWYAKHDKKYTRYHDDNFSVHEWEAELNSKFNEFKKKHEDEFGVYKISHPPMPSSANNVKAIDVFKGAAEGALRGGARGMLAGTVTGMGAGMATIDSKWNQKMVKDRSNNTVWNNAIHPNPKYDPKKDFDENHHPYETYKSSQLALGIGALSTIAGAAHGAYKGAKAVFDKSRKTEAANISTLTPAQKQLITDIKAAEVNLDKNREDLEEDNELLAVVEEHKLNDADKFSKSFREFQDKLKKARSAGITYEQTRAAGIKEQQHMQESRQNRKQESLKQESLAGTMVGITTIGLAAAGASAVSRSGGVGKIKQNMVDSYKKIADDSAQKKADLQLSMGKAVGSVNQAARTVASSVGGGIVKAGKKSGEFLSSEHGLAVLKIAADMFGDYMLMSARNKVNGGMSGQSNGIRPQRVKITLDSVSEKTFLDYINKASMWSSERPKLISMWNTATDAEKQKILNNVKGKILAHQSGEDVQWKESEKVKKNSMIEAYQDGQYREASLAHETFSGPGAHADYEDTRSRGNINKKFVAAAAALGAVAGRQGSIHSIQKEHPYASNFDFKDYSTGAGIGAAVFAAAAVLANKVYSALQYKYGTGWHLTEEEYKQVVADVEKDMHKPFSKGEANISEFGKEIEKRAVALNKKLGRSNEKFEKEYGKDHGTGKAASRMSGVDAAADGANKVVFEDSLKKIGSNKDLMDKIRSGFPIRKQEGLQEGLQDGVVGGAAVFLTEGSVDDEIRRQANRKKYGADTPTDIIGRPTFEALHHNAPTEKGKVRNHLINLKNEVEGKIKEIQGKIEDNNKKISSEESFLKDYDKKNRNSSLKIAAIVAAVALTAYSAKKLYDWYKSKPNADEAEVKAKAVELKSEEGRKSESVSWSKVVKSGVGGAVKGAAGGAMFGASMFDPIRKTLDVTGDLRANKVLGPGANGKLNKKAVRQVFVGSTLTGAAIGGVVGGYHGMVNAYNEQTGVMREATQRARKNEGVIGGTIGGIAGGVAVALGSDSYIVKNAAQALKLNSKTPQRSLLMPGIISGTMIGDRLGDKLYDKLHEKLFRPKTPEEVAAAKAKMDEALAAAKAHEIAMDLKRREKARSGFIMGAKGIVDASSHHPFPKNVIEQWGKELEKAPVFEFHDGYNFWADHFNDWIETPAGKKWNDDQAAKFKK